MRRKVTEEQIKELLIQFEIVLRTQIKKKGDGAFYSVHEALGVITEEQMELVQAIQSNDNDCIKAELLDVAVSAIWGVVSVSENE